MRCEQSERWISMGADQELSVQEVGLLREHLGQCTPCQALADESRDLGRWFVTAPQAPVPAGFAERVVAAAFEAPVDVAKGPRGLVQGGTVSAAEAGGSRMQGFVLQLTALAALLLVALAFALADKRASETNDLHADPTSIESVIEGLDQLNSEEAKGLEADSSKDELEPSKTQEDGN
ncbi:MAG: zf-HC2 domain-containing protein [Planctomycetes bacterium]|nr:zf-HC2 domain-containing protein [Planctomycetota bacterium]